MSRFNRLTTWFVPQKLHADPVQFARARMVASGTVVSWCVCVPVLAVLLVILRGHPGAQLFAFVMTAGGIASWVMALLILRWSGSFELCIHVLVGSGLSFIAAAVAWTGGIHSPVIVAMTVPPAFAAMFSGRRAALGWCCAASAMCVLFYGLDTLGATPLSLVPSDSVAEQRALFSVLACFLIVGILYVNEAINQQFQRVAQHETQRLTSLAHHDPLTGLANRLQFDERLQLSVLSAVQHETLLALLYVDLDNFKPINDTHGHEIGDHVLKVASQRMSQCVRISDTVARMGGDEFAIILEGVDSAERAHTIAGAIVEAVSKPMSIGGLEVRVGASSGVAMFPANGRNAAELVAAADAEMYRIKRLRKNAHAHTVEPASETRPLGWFSVD